MAEKRKQHQKAQASVKLCQSIRWLQSLARLLPRCIAWLLIPSGVLALNNLSKVIRHPQSPNPSLPLTQPWCRKPAKTCATSSIIQPVTRRQSPTPSSKPFAPTSSSQESPSLPTSQILKLTSNTKAHSCCSTASR